MHEKHIPEPAVSRSFLKGLRWVMPAAVGIALFFAMATIADSVPVAEAANTHSQHLRLVRSSLPMLLRLAATLAAVGVAYLAVNTARLPNNQVIPILPRWGKPESPIRNGHSSIRRSKMPDARRDVQTRS